MKSIISNERRCYICGGASVEKHHIYFGSLRATSERNGFYVWLCSYHHRDTKHGVHGNRSIDLQLKQICQRQYEKKHSREEFMRLIGRNYL